MVRALAGVVTASATEVYRDQLEILLDELSLISERGPRGGEGALARELDAWLRRPDVLRIVDGVPGGADRVFTQVIDEYVRFEPSAASNASSPVALVRILLLQQIDLAWWGHTRDLEDAAAIAASAELVDLRWLRANGGVRFGFGVGSDRLVQRARDYAVQRAFPWREPRGPGLPFRRARPEVIAVLNEIADRVALLAPPKTPRIWVNSIVRSVEHQTRLRRLGFTAVLPSAHCRGWAADIEMAWFERFGATGALREVIVDYLASGVLNVIDEGRAWHLCLSPDAAVEYGSDINCTDINCTDINCADINRA